MPALNGCLLTSFDIANVTYMHLPFDVTSRRLRPVRMQVRCCHLQPVILHCIVCYISCTNAIHGLSLVRKMFQDRTAGMLDWSGPSTRTWTC